MNNLSLIYSPNGYTMKLKEERRKIVAFCQQMISSGLVKGTGGNMSLCNCEKTIIAISPSGTKYETMKPEDVVLVDLQGNHIDGSLKPSSEIQFHLDLLNLRPDIHAVVHTHSPYVTTMACLRMEIPAIHYLIGHVGYKVPVAFYATFGTKALSENICAAIGSGDAVIMANHGLVTVGKTLENAYQKAEMVEYVAQLYLQAMAVSKPTLLSDEEMSQVMEKYKTYGKQNQT